jgi:tetratricopeptide (TPR) repeat protein
LKKALLILVLACTVLLGRAQVPCDSVESVFRKWNARLDQLNTEDPEIISLHYLFLQDILREMERFKTSTMLALPHCLSTDYYLVKSHFQKVAYRAGQMERLLGTRKGLVDRIFYNQAVEELHYRDTINALYNLDRALEFNKYQPDALLLKAKLKLARREYKESVELIHQLYTKCDLNEQQERDVSDFTLVLYDRLYNTGSALIKSGHSADALELFLALEQFCSNMPSGYCNDDYYHGILLSREGVYESYIAIAKEAERRNNMEMARKFYQYAEEYRKAGEVKN